MRKTTLIRLVFVVAVLAAGGAAWVIFSAPKPLNISITFAGYTNDAFGERRTALVVTNRSNISVKRWHVWLVQGRDGRPPRDAFFAVKGLPTPQPATAFLAPGGSELLLIPVPTNQPPWRAVLRFSPDSWKYRYAMWRAGTSKTRHWADALGVPYPITPHQFFTSDWIEK